HRVDGVIRNSALGFDLPCVVVERGAARREAHAARATFEQRNAELLLELAHALGERRLAHRKLARRGAQVAVPGDGEKGAKQPGMPQKSHIQQLWIANNIAFYSMARSP